VARLRAALQHHTLPATREHRLSEMIATLRREKEDLERLVCVDALTGIANRRHAMDLLAGEWKRAAREHAPLAVVMIDLDCFHGYNEQYGHLGGDACLQQVVAAMARGLRRPSDFLGRYGGEEFLAVLPDTDAVGAKIVGERLRAAVEALAIQHAASSCARVATITVGFASFKVMADTSDTIDKLIAAADVALLRAKTEGRNRVGGDAPLSRPPRVSAQRWQRYAPVHVDPWFADRIPAFLDDVRRETREGVQCSRRGERRGGALPHLRASAENIGLTAIAAFLRELDDVARGGDLAAIQTAAEALVQYVIHVQVIYRRAPSALAG
jgi:diguanylate cyclase (GGDEF)-like protein